ncbi:MAG: alpha/beta fold hydrolase [Patescibacteria group bacterium]
MFRALIYSAVFIVGFVGVSLWSFWLITHPAKIIIGAKPTDFGLEYENIELKTKDGLKLTAWFIPAPKSNLTNFSRSQKIEPARALILIHGYPAEKADMLPLAKALNSDFPAILFDMRYFGKSEGKISTLGKKETFDLATALDFLESRGYKKIGVFGFSLGGATAIMKAAEDPRINAVAAYGSFADLKLLGLNTYQNLWILKYPLVELLSLWAKIFLDYDVVQLSPQKSAQKLNIPVLIIQSRGDEQIPFEHGLRFKDALSKNPKAEFYFLENGLHGELPPDFGKSMLEFFKKSLK